MCRLQIIIVIVITQYLYVMIPYSTLGDKMTQHVVPHNGKWAVRSEGASKPSRVFDEKLQAVSFAHEVADNNDAKMVVHNEDGTIDHVDAAPHYPSKLADKIHT